jgi:hypothetical protein
VPNDWTADGARCQAAGVPETVRFATKPQIARRMLARVLEAGVPFGWVTGDTVYGNDWRMRPWLAERHSNYALGVSAPYRLCTGHERAWAATVVGRLPAHAWHRCRCGAGRKGERFDDWARRALREDKGQRHRWLLARRSLRTPSAIAYSVASGAPETPRAEMVQVIGTWHRESARHSALSASRGVYGHPGAGRPRAGSPVGTRARGTGAWHGASARLRHATGEKRAGGVDMSAVLGTAICA